MFGRKVQRSKPARANKRFLRLERLESRHMLSGVVNVEIGPGNPDVVTQGDMVLKGDHSDNQVTIQQSGNSFGQFTITGNNGTLLQLNGAGQTAPSWTVNNIFGDITVDLGPGTKAFTVAPPVGGGVTTISGDLDIFNGGADTNNIGTATGGTGQVMINGNLNVTQRAGVIGDSDLNITGATIIGTTFVDNESGGGGDSNTMINNSNLEGATGTNTPSTNYTGWSGSGGSTLNYTPAFTLLNGDGNNVTQIEGASTFGTAIFSPECTVICIVNGAGGSRVTFTQPTETTVPQLQVYGGIDIHNGDPTQLQGLLNVVTFNNVEVLGAVNVCDTGGNTQISVLTSDLGTQLKEGGPVTVFNGAGNDQLTMASSELPWGLYVDNDASFTSMVSGVVVNDSQSTGSNGFDNYGSETSIQNSLIGTRPLGPDTPNGDAFFLGGDNGPDVVGVSGTTFGGQVEFCLRGGNNSVTLDTSIVPALNITATGTGNNTVVLGGDTIAESLCISLENQGVNTVELGKGSNGLAVSLPDPLRGMMFIQGGQGVNTLEVDLSVTDPLVDIVNFRILMGLNLGII